MNKEATCKYNMNRKQYKLVLPFCSWAAENLPSKRPPHVGIYKNGSEVCSICECYEKESE